MAKLDAVEWLIAKVAEFEAAGHTKKEASKLAAAALQAESAAKGGFWATLKSNPWALITGGGVIEGAALLYPKIKTGYETIDANINQANATSEQEKVKAHAAKLNLPALFRVNAKTEQEVAESGPTQTLYDVDETTGEKIPLLDAEGHQKLGADGKPLFKTLDATGIGTVLERLNQKNTNLTNEAAAAAAPYNQWGNVIQTGVNTLGTVLSGATSVIGAGIKYGLLAIGAGFVLNWLRDTDWGKNHAWVGKAADMINRAESAVGSALDKFGSASRPDPDQTSADQSADAGAQPTKVKPLLRPDDNRSRAPMNGKDCVVPPPPANNDNAHLKQAVGGGTYPSPSLKVKPDGPCP